MMLRRIPLCLTLAAAAAVLALAPAAAADVVLDWNDALLDSVRAEKTNPPRATRAMAMMNVAIFDAVVGIAGGHQSYAVAGPGPQGASLEAAAAAAAHGVLVHLYPGREAIFDALLDVQLAGLPSQSVVEGADWGAEVAAEIIDLRADDGSEAIVDYHHVPGAGWWVATPPAFANPLLPNWPTVTPWTMRQGDQFRVPAPPPPTSPEYLAAFEEVKRLGSVDSTERTADQSEIARFWDDGAGTNTPPGHWNEILQTLSEQHGLSLIENARLFALHGMTVADAAICAWENKYRFNHWRPVTGIRLADQDGNPATEPDLAWTNYIGTPPFPAYTSGHSSFSGSSARIAELFFGSDAQTFSVASDGDPATRHFTSLTQAAEEAGQSRIYGGIHWQYDNTEGLSSGRRIAEQAFFGFLRPSSGAVTSCDPATQLCLGGGRFAVSATWRTKAGDAGAGHPVTLNAGSGSFWFFREDNTEVTVKVIDACDEPTFDRFWVFASGLTDVEVVLTVTDTESGQVRSYFNPQGTAFAPVQDTDAFATCP